MVEPIELVLFDLGGVMVRLASGPSEAASAAGVAAPALDDDRMAELIDLAARHERGELSCDAYFAASARVSGLTPRQHRDIHAAWLVEPFPGLAALVDDLHGIGVATGCLSNTNAAHWAMMLEPGGRVGLPLHGMAHRFVSFEIGCAKPDPAIYAHVERVTAVAPSRTAFFDDKAENVEAAAGRGWRAHRVTDANDPASQVRGVLRGYGLGL